jgi:hypothetical protein
MPLLPVVTPALPGSLEPGFLLVTEETAADYWIEPFGSSSVEDSVKIS